MVISETSAVLFMSSMSRLPNGGSIASTACGRMMRRMASVEGMFSAIVASIWDRGTFTIAARTISEP